MNSDPDPTKHSFDSRICQQGIHSSTKLCIKCRQLFDEWSVTSKLNSSFQYWENVALFEVAAAEGCQLCTMFLSQLPLSFFKEARSALERDRRNETPLKPLTIYCYGHNHNVGCLNLAFRFSFRVSVNPDYYRHEEVLVGGIPILTPGMAFRR